MEKHKPLWIKPETFERMRLFRNEVNGTYDTSLNQLLDNHYTFMVRARQDIADLEVINRLKERDKNKKD